MTIQIQLGKYPLAFRRNPWSGINTYELKFQISQSEKALEKANEKVPPQCGGRLRKLPNEFEGEATKHHIISMGAISILILIIKI